MKRCYRSPLAVFCFFAFIISQAVAQVDRIVIAAGTDEAIDFRAAFRKLRDDFGIQYLLCEGGPTLYGTLARADLIDEKFVTIAPVEVGQVVPPKQERLPIEGSVNPLHRPTIFGGFGFIRENMTRWTWLSCRKAGDLEFNRYRRRRSPKRALSS